MDDRVQAITNMPPPVNVSKLRAFLGMINFYVFTKSLDSASSSVQVAEERSPVEVAGKGTGSIRSSQSITDVSKSPGTL